jgi:hypothetical protein
MFAAAIRRSLPLPASPQPGDVYEHPKHGRWTVTSVFRPQPREKAHEFHVGLLSERVGNQPRTYRSVKLSELLSEWSLMTS